MSIEVEVSAFLVEHGLAEERPGYGHATGADVAAALVAQFDIRRKGENG